MTDAKPATIRQVFEGREDGYGRVGWLYLTEHVDLDAAVAIFHAWMLGYGYGDPDGYPLLVSRGGPRHTWLRKVPWREEGDGGWQGSLRYIHTRRPGPGASPVTVAEIGDLAVVQHVCSLPHCPAPYTHGYHEDSTDRTAVTWYCHAHDPGPPWRRPETVPA